MRAAIEQLEFLIDEDSRACERHCGRETLSRVPDDEARAEHRRKLREYIRALRVLRAVECIPSVPISYIEQYVAWIRS